MVRGFIASLILFSAFAAHADGIPPICSPHVKPLNSLTFDDAKHRAWYVSWWDGKCTGFRWWQLCTTGKAFQVVFMDPVLVKNPGVDRNVLVRELCSLGELIGYEYARDNDLRCISLDDAQRWGGEIKDGQGSVLARISAARAEAQSKLARARPATRCSGL